MSCRNTPAGSLATTFVQRNYGLKDAQCTSMFHELTRQFNQSQNSARPIPAISQAEYLDTANSIRTAITQNASLWPGGGQFRRNALARVDAVQNNPVPTNEAIKYAFVNLADRATRAQTALLSYFFVLASDMNAPREYVEKAFNHFYREYGALTPALRNNLTNIETSRSAYIVNAPKDDATLYALNKLSGYVICSTCDKGQYLGVNDGLHRACISTNPVNVQTSGNLTEQSEETSPIANTVEEPLVWGTPEQVERVQSVLLNNRDSFGQIFQPVESSNSEPLSPPWDMNAFQDEYLAAKAYLRQSPILYLPADMQLESVPGGITGGLGSRIDGNSFGIELELDFPDDDFPFQKRRELARRLHAEGIAMLPEVAGWHYVGDDREGGGFRYDSKGWVCEFDRTVDDMQGARGIEIKSQILFDEPDTWKSLRRICSIATELGARPTHRTGLHINVGGNHIPHDDPEVHNSMLRLAATYDDTILRLAHNPAIGTHHRGRRYCQPVEVPPQGFANVNQARAYANHYQAFNFNHLPAEGQLHRRSSRVEVRIWDSTLDPVRIQAATVLSLAVVAGGIKKVKTENPSERAGSHNTKYRGRRLEGNEWNDSTESFRRLVSFVDDMGAESNWHHKIFTTMFAVSRWQTGNDHYPPTDSDDEDRDHDYDEDN